MSSSQKPEAQSDASLTRRLHDRFGPHVDPDVTLDERDVDSRPSQQLLERLGSQVPRKLRYELRGEVARGGMGAILKIWDADLRRSLAMKVILGTAPPTGETPPADRRTLARFLEEAQVTAQLDHPGIVPVHELGLDADGRVYFTMKLVKGRDLRQVFDLVRAGAEGWSRTRALGVMLKVCEALAYAHKKGVIHRDLKPANVMVGSFGEVYVMDWGLARVMGREDLHDIRLQQEAQSSLRSVATERREEKAMAPDSPLVTMDGDVVGTPCYMALEQAEGRVEDIGPRSDVYSVGAMLYQLLTGQIPYVPPSARISNRTVLARVLMGPPAPVRKLAPEVPEELVAICEKAMARDARVRYADTLELGEDLRAFLEQRVVSAYETGAFAELRKWVARNKGLAATSAAALLLAVVGLSGVSYVQAERNRDLAAANAAIREEQSRVLGLADVKLLADTLREANGLWPALPAKAAAMERWIGEAERLAARLPEHREYLAQLREGISNGADQPLVSARGFELLWLEESLAHLVDDLEGFTDPDPKQGVLAGVRERLQLARGLEHLTIEEHRDEWERAIASIRDRSECPAYGGLEIAPQLGLVPIGRDPDSGLWEFAHWASGAPAERDEAGRLALDENMGIVLVLVPGGTFRMGSQTDDPGAPNYDPSASTNESPVTEVTLDPFFVSKYEMTQGQWMRFTGSNPSKYSHTARIAGNANSLLSPAEQIDWNDAARVLGRLALALPTEAQWEYAARADTTTPWSTGSDQESLAGFANLADEFCRSNGGMRSWSYETWLDDGYAVHAPVGSYRANAFGLHDVHGNLWEWCRDSFGPYDVDPRPGDGLREEAGDERSYRGGSFLNLAQHARSAMRSGKTPDYLLNNQGVRPVRRVE